MKNTYDFPVQLSPIYTREAVPAARAIGEPEYAEAPKRFAVQRIDNRGVLGVVSNKYKLLRHAEVVEGFRAALKDGHRFEESIKVTKGGAHMFATYSFPELKVRVRANDEIALQFTVKNSYDGGNSLTIVLGAFRLVCTNGMIIGKKFFGFRWRHVGDSTEVDVEAIKARVQALSVSFKNNIEPMQHMAAARVDKDAMQDGWLFDAKRIGLPAYLCVIAAKEYTDARDWTRWGQYNAMTYAITHGMKRESPQQAINLGRLAWEVVQKDMREANQH